MNRRPPGPADLKFADESAKHITDLLFRLKLNILSDLFCKLKDCVLMNSDGFLHYDLEKLRYFSNEVARIIDAADRSINNILYEPGNLFRPGQTRPDVLMSEGLKEMREIEEDLIARMDSEC